MKTKPFDKFISFSLSPLHDMVVNDDGIEHRVSCSKSNMHTEHDADLIASSLTTMFTGINLADASQLTVASETQLDVISDIFDTFRAQDPTVGQYASLGFKPLTNEIDELADRPVYIDKVLTNDNTYLFGVELRERILPGATVADATAERVSAFEKREGREANRKDWAISKNEITAHLLKTAPVRRTLIPIIIDNGYMHIFTSSQAKAETVLSMMRSVFGTMPVYPIITTDTSIINGYFIDIVTPPEDEDDWQEREVIPSMSAKLSDGESAVSITHECALNKRGYLTHDAIENRHHIVELEFMLCGDGVELCPDTDEPISAGGIDLTVKLSEKGIIKKFSFGKPSADALDRFGTVVDDDTGHATKFYMIVTYVRKLVAELLKNNVIIQPDDARDNNIEIQYSTDAKFLEQLLPVVASQYHNDLSEEEVEEEEDDVFEDEGDVSLDTDPAYLEAVAFVTGAGKVSISAVQRKLRTGYNRAARIVEQMEGAGIISAPGENGERKVLVEEDDDEL